MSGPLFRLVAVIAPAIAISVSSLLAEPRLVNEAADPPTVFSPDWAEHPAPAPRLDRAQSAASFGPLAPAARQPQGALSGRIIYMNGGHGWTSDSTSNGPWRLLRGINFEMNEDYGNIDQLNFFAMYCFNAGAVIVPFRPIGQQTNEIVLDNDDVGVSWIGNWTNSNSAVFYGSPGNVPYQYASLDTLESATATYTPNIPVAGYYPVYTWARHGSDRGDQLYRIRHTGGESQVRIPHHMVGNGWVYLGEYYFNAGSSAASGSVIISNLRGSAAGSVIIADAIRFGNGMGSTDNGAGVSDYPREDESARYWIRTSLGQGQNSTLYDGSEADENDSWSAPPKMSAEMNRQEAGDIFKRAHISFHSNAGTNTARGTWALITSDPTPYQSELASIAANEVKSDLVALGSPPLETAWSSSSRTYSDGYSEIDGSLFNYEMAATIIEVAFHSNSEDARLMRDSKARAAVGKAAMHAVIKFMATHDTNNPLSQAFLPEPPTNPRAVGAAGGNISLTWVAPVASGGSQAPTNYIIYRSTNGYGFGNPISVGNILTYTVTGLAADTDHYFRIAASNAGGESMPSEVVGCRVSAANGPAVLIVNAYDRLDRTSNLRQDVTKQGYVPPDGSGAIERVWPRRVNAFDYIVQHGKSISASGVAFDSCQNEAVANNHVSLANYKTVIWACGNDSAADETITAAEQTKLSAYLLSGGALFVSGSEVITDLGGPGSSSVDRQFLQNYLHTSLANSNSGVYTVTSVASGIFSGNANATVDNGSRGIYWAQAPDVALPVGQGTIGALNYSGVSSGFAGIQYDGSAGAGRVVLFGFPFETISTSAARNALMSDLLLFLMTTPPSNQPPSIIAQPQSTSIPQGSSMSVSATASGASPMSFQWRFNGTAISGATTNVYTKSNFQPVNSGFYDVIVTNSFGAVTSHVALIEATAAPVLQTAFYDHFDTNSAARWTINKSSADTRIAFNYNYAGYGIPSAPGSIGGSTLGTKFEANMVSGNIAAINISPVGGNFPADHRLTYYLWINANGPFPAGGRGSTQHATAGLGTAGNHVQWTSAGSSADGSWFAVDGEGQGSIDFYACSGSSVLGTGSGVYLAGTSATAQDNSHSYYTTRFPGGQTAPAAQQSAYPQQTGGLAAGSVGFAWREVVLTRQAGKVEWFIDGHKLASVPGASLPGNNFFLGYWDTFTSVSDNTNLSFAMIDNVRLEVFVTNIPPYIVSHPQALVVKQGSNATFTASAGGTPVLSYQWKFNNSPIAGATQSSYTRQAVQDSHQGSYSVVITNVAGSVTSSAGSLDVIPPLPLKFDSVSLLGPDRVVLTLSGEPGAYDILSSTDLIEWSEWTNVVIEAAPISTTDSTTNAVRRFYRAVPAQ